MSAVGSIPAAAAWTACARPISEPSAQTAALLDIFCALNGATRIPRRAKMRHSAAVNKLLPADELAPWIISTLAAIARLPQVMGVIESDEHCPFRTHQQFRQRRRLQAEFPPRIGGQAKR